MRGSSFSRKVNHVELLPSVKHSSYRRRLQTRAEGAHALAADYGGKSRGATSAPWRGLTRKYHECCHAGTTDRTRRPAGAQCGASKHRIGAQCTRLVPVDAGL